MSESRPAALDTATVATAERLTARLHRLLHDLPFEAVPGDFAVALREAARPPAGGANGDPVAVPSPAAGDPPLALDLVELARRLADGELRSVEVTAAALDALETVGRELGAVVRLRREEALRRAEDLDARRRAGRLVGPLHGVPLAHKDMFHRAGEPSGCGTVLFRRRRVAVTATVLERLDRAGAVDLGRLAMVEIALGVTGHNAHTGTPRNPWDPARLTGGSSSGSAAAVAARCIPAALGSDTGGSVRIPAAFCGLVGLKPTFGLVPRGGTMPLSWSLDHVGPLARSARDCTLLLHVLAGPDARDPSSRLGEGIPIPRSAPGTLRGLRVLAVEDVPEAAVQGRVRRLFAEALGALAEAGAVVERGELPEIETIQTARRVVLMAEAATLHLAHLRTRGDRLLPHTLARLRPGLAFGAATLGTALRARGVLLRRFCRAVFDRFDLIATPTVPVPAPAIAATDTDGDARFVRLSNRIGALVGPFNYLGLPAVSVPMGLVGRLPVGLQLVGPPFADAAVLGAAAAFEGVRGPLPRGPAVRAA